MVEAGLFGTIGFFAGLIGTVVGAGGGFLVVPALMHLWPERSPAEVTATSLIVVFFNGLSALGVYLWTRHGASRHRLDLKMGGLLALSALPGSLVGVFLFQGVSEGLFRFFFGLLLIVMGSFLIIRSWRNKTGSHFFFAAKKSGGEASLIKQVEDTERLHSRTRWYARSPFFTGSGAIVLSFMVAALAAGMGIGGGIFYVPALIFLFRFPVHRATATSQFVMTVMSGSALILHVDRGHFERMPLLPVLWLVGGAILGAQCGARLGPKLRGSVVVTGLAFLTVTLGLRLLLGAIFSGNLGSMLKGLFQVA